MPTLLAEQQVLIASNVLDTLVIMLAFVAERVWAHLEGVVRSTAPKRAAIAYVGLDAPSILKLRSGDSIVLDASDAALRSGSTHPDAIAEWLARKVEVRSLSGLHAKVLFIDAAPPIAVVGSANVSAHSRDGLIEAAAMTDDQGFVSQVVEQLDLWKVQSVRLDEQWVLHARRTFRANTLTKPSRARRPLLSDQAPLWIGGSAPVSRDLSPAAQRAKHAVAADLGEGFEVGSWQLLPGDEQRVKDDHQVVLVNQAVDRDEPAGQARAWSPAVVARVVPGRGRHRPVAILVRKIRDERVTFAQVRDSIRAHGEQLSWDEPLEAGIAADAVRALWRDQAS